MAGEDVLIVGYGNVGQNLYEEFFKAWWYPDIYDKNKKFAEKRKARYRFAFICVDTPRTENSFCDLTDVKAALEENCAEIYVIKSTILPGSTEELKKETGKRIVFSPEYYGTTQHCNNYDFGFTILGGDRADCIEVVQLLQNIYDGRHQFKMTDSRTAELVKYMENSWLATKVSFCQQFFDMAEMLGVSYEELRELFLLDPRVNPSHTFVYRDHPYWDSRCLNKDVRAIAEYMNAPLLKEVITFNERRKEHADECTGSTV